MKRCDCWKGGEGGITSWNERREAGEAIPELRGTVLVSANLTGANLRGAHLEGANLNSAKLIGANLSGAHLDGAHLADAYMDNAHLVGAHLAGAYMEGARLLRANLIEANLDGADLSVAVFRDSEEGSQARLKRVTLRHANLAGADLRNFDLSGTQFQAAGLSNADLTGATSMLAASIAGADVTNAKLPTDIAKFETLALVEEASKNARGIFYAMLGGCAYSCLTIASTRDLDLLTNSGTHELPIIGTPVPIVGFYFVVPALLMFALIYFQLYLRQLWDALADLPAIFPDGRRLDRRVYPWLLSALVRRHIERLQARPRVAKFQELISIFLGWWTVPLTLLGFWFRHLYRQQPLESASLALLVIAGTATSFYFHGLTVVALSVGSGAAAMARETAEQSSRPNRMFAGVWEAWLKTWQVLFFSTAVVVVAGGTWLVPGGGLDPLPELLSAKFPREVSVRPSDYYKLTEQQLSKGTTGAPLYGLNLRGVRAQGSFLAKANLSNTDLHGANLHSADLTGANLLRANLVGADLSFADLTGARFEDAKLALATLDNVRASSGFGCPASLPKKWTCIVVLVESRPRFILVGPSANLRSANLASAPLDSANLAFAELATSSLVRANLRRADLSFANLRYADLRDADLNGADLRGASLHGADLRGAQLTGAKGLSREMIASARSDDSTKLSEGLR